MMGKEIGGQRPPAPSTIVDRTSCRFLSGADSVLTDSPAGLAAWLLDHGDGGGHAICSARPRRQRAPSGALTREDVLDNITLYWLTNTAISSARLYWENKTNLYLPAGVRSLPP